jgi:hypothetical protein
MLRLPSPPTGQAYPEGAGPEQSVALGIDPAKHREYTIRQRRLL